MMQRAAEHTVIGRRPFETILGGEMKYFVGHRTFRRPESHRRASEFLLHVIAGPPQLVPRIVRIPESRWKRNVRMGYFGYVRVAHKRQNRVIEERGGNFNLALRGKLG